MNHCIEFQGATKRNGYGYTQFMGRQFLAHRLAYALNEFRHPDALKGIVVRHKCDNPRCINVEHLEPGTQRQNMDDMTARGRRVRGEKVGNSKLSEAQILEIKSLYVPRSKDANQYQLAQRFGVSQSEISQILSAKRWTHL